MSNAVASSGQWKDVTDLFREATSELTNQSPMVHVESFSLLDSMSAVEIMDPIMDQCYGLTGSMKLEDLLAVHYPSSGLTATIVVKLCQSLMMYEAAFLDGASIMESINQCIFSWAGSWTALQELATDSLLHRAILAFSKSLIYSVGCHFKSVLAADIYEDEDFQPGHRSFLSDGGINEGEAFALLESVVSDLQTHAGTDAATDPATQYLIALLNTRKQLHRFHRDTGSWVEGAVREYTRLIQQRHACSAQERDAVEKGDTVSKDGGDAGPSPVAALEASIRAAKKRNHDSCIKLMKLAQATTTALQGLLDLHKSGAAADSAQSESSIYEDIQHPAKCPEIAFALSPKLVKLHQTGPIRRVEMKPYFASVAYTQGICKELVEVSGAMMSFFEMTTVRTVPEAVAATPVPGSVTRPGILTFDHVLYTAAHVSSASLHLLTRDYFYCSLLMLVTEMPSLLWASMYCKGLPKALIDSDLVSRHWLTGYPNIAAMDTLKGLVACRSRLLATRMQNILELWGHTASEAHYMDMRFHADVNGPTAAEGANTASAPLQSQQLQWCSLWALQYTIFAMDLHMSLLVEMELIGPEEWDYFYWYWDYLCSTGVFAAEKLRTQRFHLDVEMYEHAKLEAARAKAASETSKKGATKKKGKAEPTAAPVVPVPPVQMPASREELLMKAKGMLCRGVHRMATMAGPPPLCVGMGPSSEPLIDKADNQWSSWDTKFRHRFQAFAELSNPPVLDYSDFLQATSRTLGSVEATAGKDATLLGTLAQSTVNCFQHARKVFDEARVGTLAGAGAASAGADKYALQALVSLTKVSVAGSLSAMKVMPLVKPTAGAPEQGQHTYKLCVNKSYNKQFPVLDISTVPLPATQAAGGSN